MVTTPNKSLNEPAFNSLSWDVPLNNNFTILDNALGTSLTISLGSGDYTLSSIQIQNMRIYMIDAISANRFVTLPSGRGGFWIFSNATTDTGVGPYSVFVKVSGGSNNISVPRGFSLLLFSDGSEIYQADNGVGIQYTPSGVVAPFAGTAAPTGWLMCDGASYATSAYPNLFASIQYTWGGSGSNFNIPDLRGAFIRGSGAGLNPSSRTVGSYEADGFTNHTHTYTDPGHSHTYTFPSPTSGTFGPGSLNAFNGYNGLLLGTTPSTTNIVIGNSASASATTETRPKNYALMYIIRT